MLEAFRTLLYLNTVQQDKQLQMVWLETVHARTWGVWQAGMLAWDGKVTAPAPAIYWALFGLCTAKPCCSFPQLRPRLNCHAWDQSPEGQWLQSGGQLLPHYIYQEDVFFPSHLERCEEKCFSCAAWALSKLFFSLLFLYRLSSKLITVHTDVAQRTLYDAFQKTGNTRNVCNSNYLRFWKWMILPNHGCCSSLLNIDIIANKKLLYLTCHLRHVHKFPSPTKLHCYQCIFINSQLFEIMLELKSYILRNV